MSHGTIHLVSIAATYRFGISDMTRPPSAILYVGGYLKRHGYNVKIHHIEEKDIDAAIDAILSDRDLLFVGFSVLTGRQVTTSGKMSEALKSRKPDAIVVWGGIHSSLMPIECLNFGFVDFVVIGDGEITALELADYLSSPSQTNPSTIKGLAYIRDGSSVVNERRPFETNLDNFRQDWSLVDINSYVRKGRNDTGFCFMTSRGCPHNCRFCYNEAFHRRLWRGHSADFVVSELVKIKELTGIDTVTFDDDNFFTRRKRGLEIVRRLKEHGIKVAWLEVRVDAISEEIIGELYEHGVRSIFTGWESGSPETLSKISKGFTPELIMEKTRILAKFKHLVMDASAIVGFPWESKNDISQTVSLALEMFRAKPFKVNFNIGLYVPYPGSSILKEAHAEGFCFPTDLEGWSSFDILDGTMRLPWLDRETIKRITLLDRFAKLLVVPDHFSILKKLISYSLAIIAYVRLKTGILLFPVELWAYNLYQRKRLRSKCRR